MLLAQKGEEVAQLKIKLQKVELRLKDIQESGPRRVQTTQTQTETKALLETVKPTSEVQAIDVDEPDDWCAPLGCEVVTKEEDAGCPSVRLRQFSIPLWHVPIRKHEELNSDKNPTGGRRTQRLSALNAKSKLIQGGKRAVSGLGSLCTPERNDVKRLMQDMKSVYSDLSRSGGIRSRRMRNHFTQKEQKNPAMRKEELRKCKAVQSKSDKVTKVQKKKCKYICKVCFRVFDTELGLITHVIIHKKCVDCNRIFKYPSELNNHRQHCPKLKNVVQKNLSDTSDSSSDEETITCKTQLIREEVNQTSTKQNDLCSDHVSSHTPEPWFTCRICLKKCYNQHSLAVHMGRKHKKSWRTSVTWTKPLEDTNHGGENSASLGKDTSTHVKDGNISYKGCGTVGVRGPEGFSCVICKKILKSKVAFIDHFCRHTGEKPFSCKMCPARFRQKTALYQHQKKSHLLT